MVIHAKKNACLLGLRKHTLHFNKLTFCENELCSYICIMFKADQSVTLVQYTTSSLSSNLLSQIYTLILGSIKSGLKVKQMHGYLSILIFNFLLIILLIKICINVYFPKKQSWEISQSLAQYATEGGSCHQNNICKSLWADCHWHSRQFNKSAKD